MSKHTDALRKEVEIRAKYRCEYCQTIMATSTSSFEIEHIHPSSKGGLTILINLALACRGCNLHKSNKTEGFDALSEVLVSLFNPRIDNWTTHFTWDNNPLLLIGLTAKGRATIDALKLNRPQLISVRTILQQLNRHPPII